MQKTCQCKETPVVYIQEREQETRHKKTLLRRIKRGHASREIALKTDNYPQFGSLLVEEKEDLPSTSKPLLNTPQDDMNGVSSIEIKDFGVGKDIAIMRNNGRLDIVDIRLMSEAASPTLCRPLIALEDPYTKPCGEGDSEIRRDLGPDDPFPSESEGFETGTETGLPSPHSAMTLHDSEDVDITQDAEIFIDRAAFPNSCPLATAADLAFCVKTLIVYENGSPCLILMEACNIPAATCQHIKVHAHTSSGYWFEQKLPCSLQVLLRERPNSTSGTNEGPSQERLKLIVLKDCNQRSLRILILTEQGTCMLYAMPTALEMVIMPGPNPNNEGLELAVVRNESFGYTSKRCKRRSWVSRASFGLAGIGVVGFGNNGSDILSSLMF